MYVVDASVYAPLIVILGGKLQRAMKKHKFHILDLTLYEVCSAFWKECVKLRRIDKDIATRSCRLAMKLSRLATIHKLTDLDISDVMSIAVSNDITVYDAAYIALAKQLELPIASNDTDIIQSAPKYGVRVYNLEEFVRIINAAHDY